MGVAKHRGRTAVGTSTPHATPNAATDCTFCTFPVPINSTACPHCARPQLFPNVRRAEQATEKACLDTRYKAALADAKSRGCDPIFAAFEAAAGTSITRINCSIARLQRELGGDTQIFAKYYDLERLRLHLEAPGNPDWQKRRPQAETELLGPDQNKHEIHYAALAITETGLTNYGRCSIEFQESMIAHRASCFEGNSALLYHNLHSFDNVLASTWSDRAKLCAAKFEPKISTSTFERDFPSLLLFNGKDALHDDFVEVHIFGSITARTLKSVSLKADTGRSLPNSYIKALKEKLVTNGVAVLT